ncbi:hypothetical protein B484DRAFT_169436 [Ochromonadaceae sp. CCMP2298]|nr:hypothetical protein B484DRAFT_169436 [Ochromonadaceae sp. CCMP2298]|mmetsp:Transcript_12098/g.26950  ORF Transcript_12098/g.26950 Transcript_12098/m.26950 type:complete len:213 (-) Transcript_12098:509-1147(-)
MSKLCGSLQRDTSPRHGVAVSGGVPAARAYIRRPWALDGISWELCFYLLGSCVCVGDTGRQGNRQYISGRWSVQHLRRDAPVYILRSHPLISTQRSVYGESVGRGVKTTPVTTTPGSGVHSCSEEINRCTALHKFKRLATVSGSRGFGGPLRAVENKRRPAAETLTQQRAAAHYSRYGAAAVATYSVGEFQQRHFLIATVRSKIGNLNQLGR